MADRPRLLATGFGPFPGASENPTEALVGALAGEAPEAFGASLMKAVVLPTEYRRSWEMLQSLHSAFAPDVVVHFGLHLRAEAIHVERIGRNAVDPAKPDAAGFAPPDGRAHASGPDVLHATLPVSGIVAALAEAGLSAMLSDDAGGYVCNATLYRSLHEAGAARRVGFIHVPPEGRDGMTLERLVEAATIALRTTVASHVKTR
jgi:pyroglutamyl-peptidase